MPIYTNTTASSPVNGTTYSVAPAILNGNVEYCFPWICTARSMEAANNGIIAPKSLEAARTASTCYMRGLKEKIQIQTSSGVPWQWRRVCFASKDDDIITQSTNTLRLSTITNAGWVRMVNNVGGTPMFNSIIDPLFRGSLGGDFQGDLMTAALDTTRVDVKYDKTVIIQSGNQSGVMRNFNRWHPMNKNLVYDDEQAGGTESDSYYSTRAKPGMGDYYVIDFIRAGTGAQSSDNLSFNPASTLYWHEK